MVEIRSVCGCDFNLKTETRLAVARQFRTARGKRLFLGANGKGQKIFSDANGKGQMFFLGANSKGQKVIFRFERQGQKAIFGL